MVHDDTAIMLCLGALDNGRLTAMASCKRYGKRHEAAGTQVSMPFAYCL